MKKLYFFCLALLAASPLLPAQPITLTSSNYGTLQPGDNLFWQFLHEDQIGVPERGANRVWDYSGVPTTDVQGQNPEQPNNPAFAAADVRIPTTYSFAGYNLAVAQYYNFSEQGHFGLGDSYAATVLPGLEEGDTLFLPAQNVPLPRTEVLFPATFGSSWASAPVRYVLNAEIKTSVFPKVPAQFVQNFMTTTDTVIGWGLLRLPDNTSLNVLLKKQVAIRVDSFYLAGLPAPSFVLDQLGLKQGDITNEENYIFYGENLKGEAMAIRVITRGTTSFKTVYFNGSILTSVHDDNADATTRMYPDPAQEGNAVLSFRKTNSRPWSVVICDMLGREVFRRSVDEPQGDIRLPVQFGTASASGLYVYSIYSDTGIRVAAGTVRAQ